MMSVILFVVVTVLTFIGILTMWGLHRDRKAGVGAHAWKQGKRWER